MSKRYFTADLHWGHGSICIYCNRPCLIKEDVGPDGKFISPEAAIRNAEKMDKWLIKRINGKIKPEDDVVFVGDFINRGVAKGVPGLRNNPKDYLDDLNGTWHLLTGNHDGNNKVRTIADYMFTRIAGLNVFVGHYPTENVHVYGTDLLTYVYRHMDVVVCGHIHEKWKTQWISYGKTKLLNINVGVDANNWYPLSDSDIFEIYSKETRNEQLNKTRN